MKRPKKKDYIRGSSQMDYSVDLARYYDTLEMYVDHIESEYDFISNVRHSLIGTDKKTAKRMLKGYKEQQLNSKNNMQYNFFGGVIVDFENSLHCA